MAYKKVAQTKALPRLQKVRFRNQALSKSTNECFVMMSTLLNCWAANGEGAALCLGYEHELKTCMETFKPAKKNTGLMSYDAGRLYPRFTKG